MKLVNLKIDDVDISVPAGTSILDAAKQAGIKIPTLCYHPDLPVKQAAVCVWLIRAERNWKLHVLPLLKRYEGNNKQ